MPLSFAVISAKDLYTRAVTLTLAEDCAGLQKLRFTDF